MSIRLTLSADVHGAVQIVRSQYVRKRVPVVRHFLDDFRGECGFWVEVHDPTGHVLFRKVMHDPTTHWEYPGDLKTPPDQMTTRRDAPGGLFSIVVPEIDRAATVVIMASRPADAAARPIARIPVERA